MYVRSLDEDITYARHRRRYVEKKVIPMGKRIVQNTKGNLYGDKGKTPRGVKIFDAPIWPKYEMEKSI